MLPELTHLQFLVLSLLLNGERSGRYIREQLAKQGEKKTLAAFYQMMARLEEGNMVQGWYETNVIDGQTVKQRYYRILAHGVTCWERTRDFYRESALAAGSPLVPEAG
jgi:DNA-binding PadR family transcriptional regulator